MKRKKLVDLSKTSRKLLFLAILLFLTTHVTFAQNLDSILHVLRTTPDNEEKLILLEDICRTVRKTDPKKAKEYALQQLALSQKLNIPKAEASAYSLLGGFAFNEANYPLAMDYFMKNLLYFEKTGDKERLSGTYSNIANVLTQNSQPEKALSYYHKAMLIQEKLKKPKNLVIVYMNMGIIYKELRDFTNAKNYNLKALALSDSLQNTFLSGSIHHNLGSMYETQKEPQAAIKHYLLALALETASGDEFGKATTEISLGDVFNDIGSYQKALPLLLSGLHFVKEQDESDWVLSAYMNLADCYSGLKEHEEANVYLRKHRVLFDSIHNIEKQKQISELQIKYETEKKEQEIELLIEKEIAAKAISEKRKLYIIITLISALLLLAGLLLIVLRNKNLKKRQAFEVEKKRLIFEQQALKAQMNPHFIFNALNSIQSYILNNESQMAYDYLAKFSKLIRQVLQNSEFDSISLKGELELLNTYIQLESKRFKNRFNYEIKGMDDITLQDIKIPVMLMQPYVENAIWHGIMNLDKSKTGVLIISLELNDDILKIIIEDNGVGRKESSGYPGKHKKSMGMTITQKRLDLLNATARENTFVKVTDLEDETGKATGTRVEISISIN